MIPVVDICLEIFLYIHAKAIQTMLVLMLHWVFKNHTPTDILSVMEEKPYEFVVVRQNSLILVTMSYKLAQS